MSFCIVRVKILISSVCYRVKFLLGNNNRSCLIHRHHCSLTTSQVKKGIDLINIQSLPVSSSFVTSELVDLGETCNLL